VETIKAHELAAMTQEHGKLDVGQIRTVETLARTQRRDGCNAELEQKLTLVDRRLHTENLKTAAA
jgi:hypothetical protein